MYLCYQIQTQVCVSTASQAGKLVLDKMRCILHLYGTAKTRGDKQRPLEAKMRVDVSLRKRRPLNFEDVVTRGRRQFAFDSVDEHVAFAVGDMCLADTCRRLERQTGLFVYFASSAQGSDENKIMRSHMDMDMDMVDGANVRFQCRAFVLVL